VKNVVTHGAPSPGLDGGGGPRVIRIGQSEEARHLADLLCNLPPAHRRAIFALAAQEGLQLGVLKAGLEYWPEDLPALHVEAREERRAT